MSTADRNRALLKVAKAGDAAKCGLLAAAKADVNCRDMGACAAGIVRMKGGKALRDEGRSEERKGGGRVG